MRKSRFSESQIRAILKEADAGMKVEDICRQYGISNGTYYNWKSKYGDEEALGVKRIEQLEGENAILKKLFADVSLENAMLKDLFAKKGY